MILPGVTVPGRSWVEESKPAFWRGCGKRGPVRREVHLRVERMQRIHGIAEVEGD